MKSLSAGAIALLACLATPAAAVDVGPFGVSANVALVSDYRFRGISFSNRDPAVQGGIDLATAPGLFLSVWGSTIADFNGANTEIDLIAGWSIKTPILTPSVGIIGYFYPGGTGTDIYELFGTLGAALGTVSAEVGVNFAPDQGNLAGSSRYAFGSASVGIPGTPVTLRGQLGFERGSLVADETGSQTAKTDWLVGADLSFAPVTLGIAWVGTDLPGRFPGPAGGPRANRLGGNGVVLSITAGF